MTFHEMLPPPRAAPEHDQVDRAPSASNPPVHAAPASSAPLRSTLAPVALWSSTFEPGWGAVRPARESRRLSLAVLAASAAVGIGSLAFVVASGYDRPVASISQAFPRLALSAELFAAHAATRSPEPSSAAAFAAPGGVAQPAAREGAAPVLVEGAGRIAKRIILPEIVFRSALHRTPASSFDPKVQDTDQHFRSSLPQDATEPASERTLR